MQRPALVRWLAARPRIFDVLIILVCTAPMVTALVIVSPAHAWLGYLCAVGVGAAFWWRRSYPLPVLLIAVGLAALNPIGAAGTTVAAFESFFGVYTLASLTRLRTAILGYLVSEVVIFAVSGITIILGFRDEFPAVLLQPIALTALAIGIAVRASRARHTALADMVTMREERAAAAERARITAEMHDVVAHSVTVMVALAGGARAGWQKHPERARKSLEQLGDVGESALEEMQRILRLLRDNDDALDADLELSGHNVPSIEEQVEVFRTAGLPVTLVGTDTMYTHEPALRTTVHRIVQEGLTNALRYAQEASYVEVAIHQGKDRLTVSITDNSKPGPATTRLGAGVGLRAMRERAEVFGGTLESGPLASTDAAPGTGWRTRVSIPLKSAEPT
ncbi:histidine kinase [Nesterenkonia ebinurensis]|uniref:histidine kinase n=1 Tax=Nesterenkonia ebinurensis TaxID=2608252 RepID=UPI00168A48AE|nr:histidine kinase [Nesterenkonia ebinurensis]